MGIVERLTEMNTGALVALVAGVAVVGGVMLLALTVVFAAILGTFVLGVGEDVETNVQAGASVTSDEDASEAMVTFTSNRNAEYLLVEWRVTDGGLDPPEPSGDATAGAGEARLSTVGAAVTLPAADPGTDTSLDVTVTAVAGDEKTVVLTRDVTM